MWERGGIPLGALPADERGVLPILLSSAVERATVNRLVPGSNPGEGACLNSSAVEHLVYTEAVGGSIPSSSIVHIYYMTNEFIQKLQEIEEKLNHVSNQMQELREAVRESSNQVEELSVREFYEHPWYKYKRELIESCRNYSDSK